MSADNGIYIVIFPDGYRVAHCQNIEDIDYFPEGTKERKQVLYNYFGKCKLYDTEDEAMIEAKVMYDTIMEEDWDIVEYGIQILGEAESFQEIIDEDNRIRQLARDEPEIRNDGKLYDAMLEMFSEGFLMGYKKHQKEQNKEPEPHLTEGQIINYMGKQFVVINETNFMNNTKILELKGWEKKDGNNN